MESFGTTMFFELCRLCLKNPGEIVACKEDSTTQDIFLCTGIKINPNDNLPQNVCSCCMEIVNSCKELRCLAEQNDHDLRVLFGDTSSSQEELDISSAESVKKTDDTTSTSYSEHCGKSKVGIPKISVRTDLFVKPSQSTDPEEEPKYEKKRKKRKTSHGSEEENKNWNFNEKNKSTVSNKNESDSNNKSETREETTKKLSTSNVSFKCELICNICSKTFDTNKKLYLHKRTHDKKIICPIDVCGKKFTNKSELERHVRTHTGEKPFNCDLCDKSFSQNVTLKQHKETVHSVFT